MHNFGGYLNNWSGPLPLFAGAAVAFVIAIVAIWSIIWKGMALWKSARHGHKGWFVALLILNTVGILDILYIYFFSKKNRAK